MKVNILTPRIKYQKKSVYLFLIIFFCLSFSPINLNSFTEKFSKDLIEPLTLLIVCFASLLLLLNSKTPVNTNHLELIFLFLIFFIVIKNALCNTLSLHSLSLILLVILFYCSFKSLLITLSLFIILNIIKYASIFTLFILVLFGFLSYYFIGKDSLIYFLPNSSIFSIILACHISFLSMQFASKRHNLFEKLNISGPIILLIVTAIFLLILLKGRSGWLGLLGSFTLYGYFNIGKRKQIFVIIIFVILFIIFLLFKPSSSLGRILIYKVSFKMFKDNWLLGVGNNNFKINYNHYQAAYFESHDLDSKEALLADNSYYAFNDFYQLLVENGLIAFLFYLLLLIFFLKHLYYLLKDHTTRDIYLAPISSFSCVMIGALFSYPFQVIYLSFYTLMFFVILSSTSTYFTLCLTQKIRTFLRTILFVLGFALLTHFVFNLYVRIIGINANKLQKSGFRTLAIQEYEYLNKLNIIDNYTEYNYARELYNSGMLEKAKSIIKNCKTNYSSNELLRLSGNVELELKNYNLAEYDFKKSLYMVPNRMVSRAELFDFYLLKKDTIKAIIWGKSLLKMPIKVPSIHTKSEKMRIQNIMSNFP